MKTVPKYITKKIYRVGQLMDQIVRLNLEIEEWIEQNAGVKDGFDFSEDNRDDRGYAYWREGDFIAKVERRLNEGGHDEA